MDLVSLNIRGAVLALSPYVTAVDTYMSWARHRFLHPDYNNLSSIQQNPGFYDSLEIFSALSQSVNWSDQDQATRGLRALSQFARYASCDDYHEAQEFDRIFADIRIACKEDGFEFTECPPTISHGQAVALDELNIDGLSTTGGILRKIKQINRALVGDKDNLEVIGFSKDLMEATAGAVLQERGHSVEAVRKMNAGQRCSQAMAELGITANNGSGKIAEGLTYTRKALNKIVEGVSEMRREDTDEGHGMAGVRVATDSQAKLAISTALLWCHYILDKFHEDGAAPF